MVEREKQLFPEESLDKFRMFAARLAEWDQEIVEIIAIQEPVGVAGDQLGKISLVCSFEPGSLGIHHACLRVINLLLRDEYEKVSQEIGIEQAFDFGFLMDCEIFLPSGKTVSSLEGGVILWSGEGGAKQ